MKKRYIIFGLLGFSILFPEGPRVTALRHDPATIRQQEPVMQPGFNPGTPGRIVYPNHRNGIHVTLVDSSKNGFGLVSGTSHPLWVSEEGWLMAYRQWQGSNASSGIIGSARSENGLNWTIDQNLNPDTQVGRYPSALGTEAYPYIFWNGYTNEGPGYGGRGLYIWDQLGWPGVDWSEPYDVDSQWESFMDHWMLCPDVSWSTASGIPVFNVAVDDWTSSGVFVYHSETVENGLIVFGSAQLIFNEIDDLAGDGISDYTSAPILDINESGIGYYAVSGYFLGALEDPPDSDLSNTHTLIMKKTEDYGESWFGGQLESDYFFVGDDVLQAMVDDGLFPGEFIDDCDPGYEPLQFDGLFLTYDFDLKVDSQGNPHFITGAMPYSGDGVYPGMPGNAFIHLWIDHEYLSDPGAPNSPTGWNYSRVMDAQSMWRWDNEDGDSYWHIVFPSLAISEENDDVLWVVISGPDPGEFVVTDDGGTPDDTCDDLGLYPEWNEDVFVVKSMDGGETWWCPFNATDTQPDCWVNDEGQLECSEDELCEGGWPVNRPDEVSAHAGNGATDTMVPIIYQMPDWCWGFDPVPAADHKTRLFVGWVELETEDISDCNEPYVPGDVNCDGQTDILDIVSIVGMIMGYQTPPCWWAADCNEDGIVNILDIMCLLPIIIFPPVGGVHSP